jgi:acetyl esterase/lipase
VGLHSSGWFLGIITVILSRGLFSVNGTLRRVTAVQPEGIPPFLILHVADDPDTTAQAFRLGTVLKAAGVETTVFAAKETNHGKLKDNLGATGDPATKVLLEFVDACLKSSDLAYMHAPSDSSVPFRRFIGKLYITVQS